MLSDNEKHQRRLDTFRSLVNERTTRLTVAWVQIEQGAGGPEVVTDLLGTLHTLKGEAGLLGFTAIARLAHSIEELVQRLRASGQPPSQDAGQLILDAFDVVVALARRAPEAPAPEIVPILAAIEQYAVPGTPPTNVPVEPAARPEPGPAPVPPPATPMATPSATPSTVIDPPPPGTESASKGGAGSGSLGSYAVRVNPRQLDRMRDIIGQLLLARTRLSTSAAALHEQRYGVASDAQAAGVVHASGRDDVLRSIESQLRDDVLRMSNLVTALDEITRELRMVSISVLFDRYPLAVRNISRELGRQVSLVWHGEAVEADRDVLEALDAPLLHLVRNALDHGIEPPDVRRAAGKPPSGTLTLSARVASDSLQVAVSDDGAGIDIERVRNLVVERGLIDPTTSRSLSEHQVLQCLFMPGISTRTAVTSISGRGVGLDVVQRTVRNLGGTVELTTKRGAGTTFHITVPIRASISSVLLFRVGQGWYALPASSLVGLLEADELPQIDSIDGPAVQYDGNIVPLIALDAMLGESAAASESPRAARLIMARQGERMVALAGSHSHLQREAVLTSVSTLMREDRLISAGLGLEDGSVALVINVGEVLKTVRGPSWSAVLAPTATANATRQQPTQLPAVLVAEDSPIVRDLIVESLRAHGLRVIEASDGQEALERLAQHTDIELLVTDVEMPRLDGLGLIARMRARGGKRIPAVVVSTRGSDADKLAAVQVGADAYLVKSDFSREGLWAIVSRFLG